MPIGQIVLLVVLVVLALIGLYALVHGVVLAFMGLGFVI